MLSKPSARNLSRNKSQDEDLCDALVYMEYATDPYAKDDSEDEDLCDALVYMEYATDPYAKDDSDKSALLDAIGQSEAP